MSEAQSLSGRYRIEVIDESGNPMNIHHGTADEWR